MNALDPLDHQIPYEAVQSEVRGSVDLGEFDSRPAAINPSHLPKFDGKRFLTIWQQQPECNTALRWQGAMGPYRTAKSRQIDDDTLSNRREHAIHRRIADRQAIEPTMVRSDGVHD